MTRRAVAWTAALALIVGAAAAVERALRSFPFDPVAAALAGETTVPEISAELRARFRAHADDPSHAERVVVTLRPGVEAALLERAGMRVEHVMRNQPIVTGEIDAAALEAMTALDGVVRIEPDGEMRALDG